MARKVTNKFINDIHLFFLELGYMPKDGKIDKNDFLDCVEYSIIHADNLKDVKGAIILGLYVVNNWESVERIFKKYKDVWDSLPKSNRKLLKINKEAKKCKGKIYLNNCLNGNDVLIGYIKYGNRLLNIRNVDAGYDITNYKLRSFPQMKYRTQIIDSKTNKTIVSLRFLDDFNLYAEYNSTDYALMNVNDNTTLITNKEFINSIRENGDITAKVTVTSDNDNIYAAISKTYLDDEEDYGLVAQITLFHLKGDDYNDCFEFILAIALSFFSNYLSKTKN